MLKYLANTNVQAVLITGWRRNKSSVWKTLLEVKGIHVQNTAVFISQTHNFLSFLISTPLSTTQRGGVYEWNCIHSAEWILFIFMFITDHRLLRHVNWLNVTSPLKRVFSRKFQKPFSNLSSRNQLLRKQFSNVPPREFARRIQNIYRYNL